MNTICNAYPVAGGGMLTVTLVTPDPATPDHVRLLAGLALAANYEANRKGKAVMV